MTDGALPDVPMSKTSGHELMTDTGRVSSYEYACQRWDRALGRWEIVGLGPTPLDTAREDYRAWVKDCPGRTFRIARRPVADWRTTDQSYTDSVTAPGRVLPTTEDSADD